jgi:hypothetical protein
MDYRSKVFAELAERILVGGAYKSTWFAYKNDNLTIKATRKRFGGKINKDEKRTEIMFTIGKPNYEEREAIKKAKKEGIVLTFRTKHPIKK